jgi:arginyl-tRNA synthetase
MGDETSTSVAPQEQESTVVSALSRLLPLWRRRLHRLIPFPVSLLDLGLTVQRAGSVKQQLSRLVLSSLRATVPDVEVEPMVEVSAKFADYQWYVFCMLPYLLHQPLIQSEYLLVLC